ncbi:hypothetical protein [Maridesulfovibrio bastinii]|uniref:hypothetical protein n=1 Tax=Maridesulfovibrio bastinii TaxID=47157 RepID=UPI0004825B07|nr:hypothetical protein [Maridesulfovibrio bastinii]
MERTINKHYGELEECYRLNDSRRELSRSKTMGNKFSTKPAEDEQNFRGIKSMQPRFNYGAHESIKENGNDCLTYGFLITGQNGVIII